MLVQFFHSSVFWVYCFSNLLRHWYVIWLCSLLRVNQFQHLFWTRFLLLPCFCAAHMFYVFLCTSVYLIFCCCSACQRFFFCWIKSALLFVLLDVAPQVIRSLRDWPHLTPRTLGLLLELGPTFGNLFAAVWVLLGCLNPSFWSRLFIDIFLASIHSHTLVCYIGCFLSRFPISVSTSVTLCVSCQGFVFLPQLLF